MNFGLFHLHANGKLYKNGRKVVDLRKMAPFVAVGEAICDRKMPLPLLYAMVDKYLVVYIPKNTRKKDNGYWFLFSDYSKLR